MEVETIIIKRRRQRLLLLPEPCLNESSTRAPPDIILPGECRLLDLIPDSDSTRERYPCPRHAGKSSLVLSPGCSHSALTISNHERQRLVALEFSKDATSRVRRKYRRRNRPAETKLDVHHHREDYGSPLSAPTTCHDEIRPGDDQQIPDHPRIRIHDPEHRAPRHRRKKPFGKQLSQRLFEAGVFNSGTSSRPTLVQDPTHTSSRRPLQFVTSLGLTPSLKTRIYQKKGLRGLAADGGSSTTDWEMPAASEFSSSDASRNRRNGAATQRTHIVRSHGIKAFRARGGKQRLAQVAHRPFGYAPLPLVPVKTHYETMQTRSGARQAASLNIPVSGRAVQARGPPKAG